MKRWTGIAVVICLVFAGCRNNPYCGGCGGGVMIPPPPTYSVNPAGNQAYYNGQTASNTGLLNPNGAAPTTSQNGWRSAANTDFTLGSGATASPRTGIRPNTNPNGSGTSVLDRPVVRPGGNTGAMNGASPNLGSQNLSRIDDSRLVLTDASQVRAPAPANQVYGAPRLPRSPVVVSGQPVLVSSEHSGGQFQYYSQTPTMISGGYQTVPAVSNVSYGAGSPQVLGQSTATYDPQSSGNYRNGWRDSQVY